MLIVIYPYEIENDAVFEFEYYISGYTPNLLQRFE